jgi:hypothetical protein
VLTAIACALSDESGAAASELVSPPPPHAVSIPALTRQAASSLNEFVFDEYFKVVSGYVEQPSAD